MTPYTYDIHMYTQQIHHILHLCEGPALLLLLWTQLHIRSELMTNYHVSCLSRLLFMFSLVSNRERRRGKKVGDRYCQTVMQSDRKCWNDKA